MKNKRTIAMVILTGITIAQLAAVEARAALYQLDNGSILTAMNASDGTESRDNWFGNLFTAQADANLITRVDFGVFTTTPGSVGSVVLYQVTGAGGNPALGATHVYTQSFTPLTGDGQSAFLQQINLSTPVAFNPGDLFLVSVFIPNVVAASPNDVYPFLLDTSRVAAGSYWGRSNPNTFNLDDLSNVRLVNESLGGTWQPGPGHLIIRAYGVPVPEPATFVAGALLLLPFGFSAVRHLRRK